MTFEEFFKKKKISLPLLQDAEPAMFAEFEHHFAQMGEKSFDHTKKYWFNKLRRSYPLPPEVKAEKLVIENPLAEQTITEALTEPATATPSVGFKPRFKSAAPPKPTEEQAEKDVPATEEKNADTVATPPATVFKPRFKATMAAKPAEEKTEEQSTIQPAPETPAAEEAPKPAVGFKPRFKASMVAKPAEEKTEEQLTAQPAPETPAAEEAPKPAVGFKPRFKASMVAKPDGEKTEEQLTAQPTPETPASAEPDKPVENIAEPNPDTTADTASKPVGFKPRFNAARMKPKNPDAE